MEMQEEAPDTDEIAEAEETAPAPIGGLPKIIGTSRLEAFSDGVLAVIITITVLDIHPPKRFDFSALLSQLFSLLIYALSFAFVGIYWNNHHHLLRATRGINSNVMWANLYLLFWISLIPVCTGWAADSLATGNLPEERIPVIAYGGIGLMAGVAYFILTRAIIQANKGTGIEKALGQDTKGTASLFIYIFGMLVAFLSPPLAYVIYACVSIMWFIPDRRLVRS